MVRESNGPGVPHGHIFFPIGVSIRLILLACGHHSTLTLILPLVIALIKKERPRYFIFS